MRTAGVLRILFLFAATLVAGQALANQVGEMRIIGDPQRTRFVVDLEKSPQYGILRLTNPNRLVIDMSDVDFDTP